MRYGARDVWVHLFRHGIAIDREDPSCPPDPERALTDRGTQRTAAAAAGIAALGIEPDLVLTSPYVRARQTAELAVAAVGGELVETEALVDEDPEALCAELRGRAPRVVICVGHAPDLDDFAAYLIGTSTPVIRLKKAGLASLDVMHSRRGGGSLFAVYPPRALRRLGGGD